MQNKPNRNLLLILLGLALLLCCCCIVIAGLVGASVLRNISFDSSAGPERPVVVVTRIATATPRPRLATPVPQATAKPGEATSAPKPEATPGSQSQPGGGPAVETQGIPSLDAEAQALVADEMPAADQRDLALRLKPEVGDIPISRKRYAAELQGWRHGPVLGFQQRHPEASPGHCRVTLHDRPRGGVG